MEEILIPMECLYDIPSLNHMSMPDYKKGDIFMFNPDHEVHVELYEHGVFKEVENNLCEFICQYLGLNINGHIYKIGEKVADKDIESCDESTLKNLYNIGYIQKKLINNKQDKKQVKKKTKTTKAKNKPSETYSTLAKKLSKNKDEFKKAVLDSLGIDIKDMRKKVPSNIKKKIIGALK